MTGTEAVNAIWLCRQKEETFGLVFVTMDGEIRKLDNCVLRSAPRTMHDTDRFLYFTDNDTAQPKQCRKRLIRQVRVHNQWHQVKWFN